MKRALEESSHEEQPTPPVPMIHVVGEEDGEVEEESATHLSKKLLLDLLPSEDGNGVEEEVSAEAGRSPLPSPPRAPLHPSEIEANTPANKEEEDGEIDDDDGGNNRTINNNNNNNNNSNTTTNNNNNTTTNNNNNTTTNNNNNTTTNTTSGFKGDELELEEGEQVDRVVEEDEDGGGRSGATTPAASSVIEGPKSVAGSSLSTAARKKFVGCSQFEDYEVMDKIGEGTFGEVSTYRHKSSGAVFALKRVLMHNEKEGIPITALREIKILKSLRHENIVSLTEMAFARGDRSARARGSIYMVFPYSDHDLTGLLENPIVKLSIPQLKSYFQQLLRAVDYLHKNKILHRDIKGANILIDNRGHLKLIDFGLARAYSPENPDGKYTNMVVTRWYRPPELFLGAVKYNSSVDMWGVGCVLGEMLKRRPILTGSSEIDQLEKIFQLCGTPTDENWPKHKDLPEYNGMASAFKNHYARNIKERFSTFGSFAIDLLDCLLKLDPSKRLTAEKALRHNWFLNHPLPARPGTSDFGDFPSSHEYTTRKARQEAERVERASSSRGGSTKGPDNHNPRFNNSSHHHQHTSHNRHSGNYHGGGGGGGYHRGYIPNPNRR